MLDEARPHTGLAWDGAAELARVGRERDMLELPAGLDVAPAPREFVDEAAERIAARSSRTARYPSTVA